MDTNFVSIYAPSNQALALLRNIGEGRSVARRSRGHHPPSTWTRQVKADTKHGDQLKIDCNVQWATRSHEQRNTASENVQIRSTVCHSR